MTADICQWELTFRFRNEDRCKKFIKKLLDLPFALTFTYSSVYGDGGHYHQMEITGSWAKSLRTVAKLMEKVDYEPE
jgi:hypothetical protein